MAGHLASHKDDAKMCKWEVVIFPDLSTAHRRIADQ